MGGIKTKSSTPSSSMDMDSTSHPPTHSSSTHSLDGLILGQKIYFDDVSTTTIGAKSRSGSSSLGSGSGSGQPPRCQVEGCKMDLSDTKAYYSRHKVCIMHSKSPKVVVNGIEQRFCQQCSRFHQLSKFDQDKRSCRRRLAGHNERRRKPSPAPLLSSRYGQFSSSIFDDSSRGGGRFIMDFSAYPRISSRDAWSTVRSPEQVIPVRSVAQWQSGNSQNIPSDHFLQSSIITGNGRIPQGECFTGVADSNCALSLLSNQLWGFTNTTSSLRVDNSLMDVGASQQTTNSVNQFVNNTPWGFKNNEAAAGLIDMRPDLGLSQISQQQSVDGVELSQQRRQYMELEQSRAYGDSSTQHVHWSL